MAYNYFVRTNKSENIIWGDEPKRIANLEKHGMNFADINDTFVDNAVVIPSHNRRYRAIGINIRGVVAVVFAIYGQEAVSVISMRPATRKERRLYEENRR